MQYFNIYPKHQTITNSEAKLFHFPMIMTANLLITAIYL